jgi:hypothetical protein
MRIRPGSKAVRTPCTSAKTRSLGPAGLVEMAEERPPDTTPIPVELARAKRPRNPCWSCLNPAVFTFARLLAKTVSCFSWATAPESMG